MSYLIGIDLGTSSLKTILIDEDGKVLGEASEEYPIDTPLPNWAEQDPERWWRATKNTLRKVLTDSGVDKNEIKGISFSGQMHGTVLVDKNGKPLRPSIIWCDQRTIEECAEIVQKVGSDNLLNIACNPAVTGFMGPSVLWVKKNEPEIYDRIYKILSPKDYLRSKLTGRLAAEVTDGSATLLLDVRERSWSRDILKSLDISEDLLPDIFESPVISGNVSRIAAEETGLPEGLPVAGGGGDQEMGAIGNGIFEPGKALVTIGTGGQLFAVIEEVKIDPWQRIHIFCHAIPGRWHVLGAMLCAGLSLRWFRDNLGDIEKRTGELSGIDPYELLGKEAEKVGAGSEGLIFLPYLIGERTPHLDPKARGVFFGLTLRHTKAHLVRAIMEGVVFGLRDALEIFKELGISFTQVVASGGGARSPLWRQIQADIFGTELVTVNVREQAAYGAALLAGVGVGVYDSVKEACERTIKIASHTYPIEKNVELYEEYYQLYRALYLHLKSDFDRVAEISEVS